ncbi:hypothetical protein Tco_0902017 [Tanacetum coccineum]
MCKIKETIRIVTTKTEGILIKLQLTNPRFIKGQNLSTIRLINTPTYQAPAYQAPAPQIQGVSKEDFHSYVKANDAVMRNMQTQGQNMQNQLNNLATSNQRLESMLGNFIKMNTTKPHFGNSPSNTVTNPKEDLKGITTRSGVAYKGPTNPITSSSPKVVKLNPRSQRTHIILLKRSTKDVPPPVFPIGTIMNQSSEPAR